MDESTSFFKGYQIERLGYLNHITLALPPAPWLPGSLAPYPSALAYALAIALAIGLCPGVVILLVEHSLIVKHVSVQHSTDLSQFRP